MPATVSKRGEKYRVVESNGSLVKNNSGTPVDSGGHATRAKALRQAQAINANKK